MSSEIVLINKEVGFGIYDTVEKSFIGFRKKQKPFQTSKNKTKMCWNEMRHAKSAFKLHTDVTFNEQTRYKIKKF